jgi:exodeoxyribonuclease VII large subunit
MRSAATGPILPGVDDLLSEPPALAAISVGELNRRVRTLIERGIARLWVEGEISNVARPASGHLYFTLKDDSAQVRAAWFRQRQRGPTLGFKNGDRVLAFGRVSLYEPRGDYQLIVEQVEAAGAGALTREFERLKKKLATEGLFDAALKRPLPRLPACIGVVTSPTGAAVRDILSVLRRRFPAVAVVIYPAAVQGPAAPAELRAALAAAARRRECDVLIVGRGGGSLEDLWAFNDEALARAIRDCPIPVVSAVGHEIDFTIADFVADVRAPTPSGAAELVVPDCAEWARSFEQCAVRIARSSRRLLDNRAQALDWLARRLANASPAAKVARQADRLRELRQRLAAAARHDVLGRERALQRLGVRLSAESPALRIERAIGRHAALRSRLVNALAAAVGRAQLRLQLAERSLKAVSPRATLERGYAIVLDAGTGVALTDARQVAPGGGIRAQLHRGAIDATVTKVRE